VSEELATSATPEARLLDAMFGGMTEEEAKYLAWLFPRVNTGNISMERARELFHKRFPESKWLHYRDK